MKLKSNIYTGAVRGFDHQLCKDMHSFVDFCKTTFYKDLEPALELYDQLLEITQYLKYDTGYRVIANGNRYIMNGLPLYIGHAQTLLVPLLGALYDDQNAMNAKYLGSNSTKIPVSVDNIDVEQESYIDDRIVNLDIFMRGKPGEYSNSIILLLIRDDAVEKLVEFAKEKHIV